MSQSKPFSVLRWLIALAALGGMLFLLMERAPDSQPASDTPAVAQALNTPLLFCCCPERSQRVAWGRPQRRRWGTVTGTGERCECGMAVYGHYEQTRISGKAGARCHYRFDLSQPLPLPDRFVTTQ